MENNTVIQLADVSKIFQIPRERRNSLKSYFLNPFKKIPKEEFKALNDINFSVKKGEFLGIIGKNGSGKSTLLKVLAGIYTPTDGKVQVAGHLVPFLELGVGFNPELTGRENIFLNGTILGMTRKFLEEKFDEIVDFAEIGDFIDLQVKNYSSGMVVRLAFSIAVQAKADIYLMDEILAVGDSQFQKKSLKKMLELLNSGATVIMVSHIMATIEKFCDRVIFLQNGAIKFAGNVEEGIEKYQLSWMNPSEQKNYFLEKARQKLRKNRDIDNQDESGSVNENDDLTKDTGDGRAKIVELKILNEQGKETRKLAIGERFSIIYRASIFDEIENPVAYVGFHKKFDQELFEMNTSRDRRKIIQELKKGDKLEVVFHVKNCLLPGIYLVWVHLGDPALYGKGLGAFASKHIGLFTIEVYDPNPRLVPEWSGVISHDFTYDIKVSR